MYVKRKVYVELTSEEKEILTKARDILQEYEIFSSSEQDVDLQDLYESYVSFQTHNYVLPTAQLCTSNRTIMHFQPQSTL